MYLVLLTIFSEDSFNTEVPVASNLKNTNTLDKFRFANIRHYRLVYTCTSIYIYEYSRINRYLNIYRYTYILDTFTLIK